VTSKYDCEVVHLEIYRKLLTLVRQPDPSIYLPWVKLG